MRNLDEIRVDIDAIDKELIELFKLRSLVNHFRFISSLLGFMKTTHVNYIVTYVTTVVNKLTNIFAGKHPLKFTDHSRSRLLILLLLPGFRGSLIRRSRWFPALWAARGRVREECRYAGFDVRGDGAGGFHHPRV